MEMNESNDLRKILESEQNTLRLFKEKLSSLIQDLLSSRNIRFSGFESRVKTINSVIEKASRPGKSYQNPLKEITDLVGLRIIMFYKEDVERVCEMIRKEFEVDERNSIDKSIHLQADQVGYGSVHLIVRLNETRGKLSEWSDFQGLSAEIQVRTILQHVWAQIEHELNYKSTVRLPLRLKRPLYTLAGLLELADREFSQIKGGVQSILELRACCEKEFSSGKWDRPLEYETIDIFLNKSPSLKEICKLLSKEVEVLDEQESDFCERFSPLYARAICGFDSYDKIEKVMKSSLENEHLEKYFIWWLKRINCTSLSRSFVVTGILDFDMLKEMSTPPWTLE